MESKNLFGKILTDKGDYCGQLHLAEMIALLGPPPKSLLRREAEWRHCKWRFSMQNSAGKHCNSVMEYFEGPFFDSEGKLFQDVE